MGGPRRSALSVARARTRLFKLSRELGRPEHKLVVLGEGNTSADVDGKTFLVKASGSQLAKLAPQQLVQVYYDGILPLLDQDLDQATTGQALHNARVDPLSFRPSVETAFHAWLLRQEEISIVAHTHPTAVNIILCSDRAGLFANRRMFPDEIVCCGPRSLLIGYEDPGVRLAAAIRDGWRCFVDDNGFTPRLILVQNHGIIAVGPTPEAVLATTFMTVKAAEIFAGACAIGEPICIDPDEVMHIHNRLDEQYRREKLKLA